MDEVAVPFGVTVDFETLQKDTVTIRERDSTKQVRGRVQKQDWCSLGTPIDTQIRVPVSATPQLISDLVSRKKTWESVLASNEYPLFEGQVRREGTLNREPRRVHACIRILSSVSTTVSELAAGLCTRDCALANWDCARSFCICVSVCLFVCLSVCLMRAIHTDVQHARHTIAAPPTRCCTCPCRATASCP
jgi:hypothetical protein